MRPSASSHVGYWERDLATNRYTWSDENYRIFGLRPQERMRALTTSSVTPSRRSSDAGGRGDGGASGWPALRRGIPRGAADGEVRFVRSEGDVVRTSQASSAARSAPCKTSPA